MLDGSTVSENSIVKVPFKRLKMLNSIAEGGTLSPNQLPTDFVSPITNRPEMSCIASSERVR